MRVRILTSVGGHASGVVVDVDPEMAGGWLSAGHVEAVAESPVAAVVVAPETATPSMPETAMRPKGRRR